MLSDKKYDNLLNEAKTLYALGHDNKYIEFQFAEQGIDDTTIDSIIKDINDLRKSNKKTRGIKLIIYGLSFISVALIITSITFKSEPPVSFIMWGMAISGVLTLVKGIADIIGL
jgi:hypothetical protein